MLLLRIGSPMASDNSVARESPPARVSSPDDATGRKLWLFRTPLASQAFRTRKTGGACLYDSMRAAAHIGREAFQDVTKLRGLQVFPNRPPTYRLRERGGLRSEVIRLGPSVVSLNPSRRKGE